MTKDAEQRELELIPDGDRDQVDVVRLELVPQAVSPDWWHAWQLPGGKFHVHGPTPLDSDFMATLGGNVVPVGEKPAPYLGKFDHHPTQAELRKVKP